MKEVGGGIRRQDGLLIRLMEAAAQLRQNLVMRYAFSRRERHSEPHSERAGLERVSAKAPEKQFSRFTFSLRCVRFQKSRGRRLEKVTIQHMDAPQDLVVRER